MANGISLRQLRSAIRKQSRTFSLEEVVDAWRRSPGRALVPWLLDTEYHAVPHDVWRMILQDSGVDKQRWVAETRDCDDFAFALRGTVPLRLGVNGLGVVIDLSSSHAYSAVLCVSGDSLEVGFVEPQRDEWVVPGSDDYKLLEGKVIF